MGNFPYDPFRVTQAFLEPVIHLLVKIKVLHHEKLGLKNIRLFPAHFPPGPVKQDLRFLYGLGNGVFQAFQLGGHFRLADAVMGNFQCFIRGVHKGFRVSNPCGHRNAGKCFHGFQLEG